MKEIDEFMKFFKDHGVEHTRTELNRSLWRPHNVPKESGSYLSVSQAHLFFDKKGKYLGALADEMGFFQKRVNT